MKRATALTLFIVLLSLVATGSDIQYSQTITVTAGTRIRVFNGRTPASSVLIQMLHGCSSCAVGYIYSADPGAACSTGQLIAELAPASSTAPGGSYSDNGDNVIQQGGIDLAYVCLDGGHSGDTILLSYRPK